MAKNTAPEVKTEQKVQTKYDRKMEARKQKEAADQKSDKRFKVISTIVAVVVIAALAIGIGYSVMAKHNASNGAYIKIGDREVTQVEFDFYYNMTVNSYLSSYSSMLPYLGVDTTTDFMDEPYSDTMTWRDMFEEMTVEQITRTYALADDAKKTGFTYDVDTAYAEWKADLESSAELAGTTVSNYVKSLYGEYASLSAIEPFIKEGLLSVMYSNELLTQNEPSAEEITAYYEAHMDDYDKVDYRSFAFDAAVTAESTEEEITAAMADAKAKAEAFMAARQAGGDFEALCVENATEETKANYEDEATEYSLSEGRFNTSVPSAAREWMYDDARAEGDIAVLEDAEYHRYYVMEFINKYFDETSNDTISSQLSSENTTAYIDTLMANYPVSEGRGKLNYLTVAETTAE